MSEKSIVLSWAVLKLSEQSDRVYADRFCGHYEVDLLGSVAYEEKHVALLHGPEKLKEQNGVFGRHKPFTQTSGL